MAHEVIFFPLQCIMLVKLRFGESQKYVKWPRLKKAMKTLIHFFRKVGLPLCTALIVFSKLINCQFRLYYDFSSGYIVPLTICITLTHCIVSNSKCVIARLYKIQNKEKLCTLLRMIPLQIINNTDNSLMGAY